MKKQILVWMMACLTMPGLACATRTGTQPKRGEKMERISTEIETVRREAGIPGTQVRLADRGEIKFDDAGGLRALGHDEKATTQDLWHLGSCTKPMTAFLIGRLVDRGLLRWDSTLSEVAPKDWSLDPFVRTITIEQLLSHASGLADVMKLEGGALWPSLFVDTPAAPVLREKLVRALLQAPTRFAPGSSFEYSNAGYITLGWVIEKVSERTWETVIQEELFQKLGMKSCGFGPAGREGAPALATQPWGHYFYEGRLQALPPGPQSDNPAALGPAGTVHCSVDDWHKFLAVFVDLEGPRSGLVSPATYKKLLSSPTGAPFTYSSVLRVEREWAKGTAYIMSGSNTFNFAFAAVAPASGRILTTNMNTAHEGAEPALSKVLKPLLEME